MKQGSLEWVVRRRLMLVAQIREGLEAVHKSIADEEELVTEKAAVLLEAAPKKLRPWLKREELALRLLREGRAYGTAGGRDQDRDWFKSLDQGMEMLRLLQSSWKGVVLVETSSNPAGGLQFSLTIENERNNRDNYSI